MRQVVDLHEQRGVERVHRSQPFEQGALQWITRRPRRERLGQRRHARRKLRGGRENPRLAPILAESPRAATRRRDG